MARIVHSIVDEEHESLRIGELRTFCVRFSVLVEPDDADAGWHVGLSAFVNDVRAWKRFKVYRRVSGGLEGIDDERARFLEHPYDVETSDHFGQWLCRHCSNEFEGVPGQAGQQDLTEDELTGYHVLLGATTWPAPLPHQLGLVRVFTVDGLDPDDRVVVVPLLCDAQEIEHGDPGGDVVSFIYPNGIQYRECLAFFSTEPGPGNNLLEADGFIHAGDVSTFPETMRRVEKKAGALFSGLLPVGQINWPDAELRTQPDSYWLDTPHARALLGCLAWQAATMVGTAFDTLLLALHMPGRPQREGQLLAPLLDVLMQPRGPAPQSAAAQQRRGLRKAVREGIQEAVRSLVQGVQDAEPDRFWQALAGIWELAGLERESTGLVIPLVQYATGRWRTGDEAFDELRRNVKVLLEHADGAAWDYLAQRLAKELAPLQANLAGEDGIERAFIGLLKCNEVKDRVVAAWGAGKEQADFFRCVEVFDRHLAEGFNGAEAARQTVGSLIADLMAEAPLLGELAANWDDGAAYTPRGIMRFWVCRMLHGTFPEPDQDAYGGDEPTKGAPAGGDAPGIFLHLVRDPDRMFEDDEWTRVRDAIKRAAGEVAQEAWTAFRPDAGRFVPEAAPGPLLVPIALDTRTDDDDGNDPFTANFAGLSVLVRQFPARWAFACLADIRPHSYSPSPLPCTLAPLPTAVMDGRRELSITYTGLPFASSAYAETIPGDLATRDKPAFYQLDYPVTLGTPPEAFNRLPRLAYGFGYEFAAHVVGRSGLLPTACRTESAPWLPSPAGPDNVPLAARIGVSRRTAIGSVSIREPVSAAQRIGVWPRNVRPLAADYRRLALEPGLDLVLLRNPDGSGMIPVSPASEPATTVALRDLRVWGEVRLHLNVGVSRSGDPSLTIELNDLRHERTIELVFVRHAEATWDWDRVNARITVKVPDAEQEAVWLAARVEGDAALVTLADPRMEQLIAEAGRQPVRDGVLLLGGKLDGATNLWKGPFDQDGNDGVDVEVVLPRMSFADFMRWTNNPALVDRALGLGGNNVQDPDYRRTCFANFRTLLVALDIHRFGDHEAAACLERLPDLAVGKVIGSVVVVDSLTDGPADQAFGARHEWIMPTFWELLEPYARHLSTDVDTLSRDTVISILEKIDQSLCRKVKFVAQRPEEALTAEDHDAWRIGVPAGMVVSVSARPCVPAHLFEAGQDEVPVIEPRLKELCVGREQGNIVFDGAHLTVEAMLGPLQRQGREWTWALDRPGWVELREKALLHDPVAGRMAYRLGLKPSDPHWRQVGRVTTRTQTWRFAGRPIYSWIDPRHYRVGDDDLPSFRLRPNAGDPERFFEFEQELFLGRDDDDAQVRTVNLLPIGHRTWLVEMPEDEAAGATIHRHSLVLHSRYAGAMKDAVKHGTCHAWLPAPFAHKQGHNPDRWIRIAVLARPSVGAQTRPQLRTLLPLTRRPDPNRDAHTIAPPVLGVLQETPFAFGGLAARIATEITIGLNYRSYPLVGGDAASDARIALVSELRKQIGPDPRLSHRAMDERGARRAVLAQEGPLGLTHDRDALTGSGFAGTALMLHPEMIAGQPDEEGVPHDGIEEHFISVSLRRYLDPCWLIRQPAELGQAAQEDGKLRVDRNAIWLDVCTGLHIDFEHAPPQGDVEDMGPVAGLPNAIRLENDIVLVHRLAIDPTAPPNGMTAGAPDELVLCELPGNAVSALLLVPQEDGRLTVVVMSRQDGGQDSRRGSGRGFVCMASVELRIGSGLQAVARADPEQAISGLPTVASAETALHWVHTNPDFDWVSAQTEAVAGEASAHVTKRFPVSALQAVARCDKGAKDRRRVLSIRADGRLVWIRPAQCTRSTPIHAQRHLVVLLSETSSKPSRLETPVAAYLMHGNSLEIRDELPGFDQLRLLEIETPAEIIGHASERMFGRYRKAHFDLVSIGASDPVAVLLRLRYAGAGQPLAGGTRIQLGLRMPRCDFESDLITTGECVELLLHVSADQLRFSEVRADGSILKREEAVRGNPGTEQTEPSVELTLDGDTDLGFEVSMLCGGMTDIHTFSFDWLFGELRSIEMDKALLPMDLAGRKEAQARIVSMTKAIDVVEVTA